MIPIFSPANLFEVLKMTTIQDDSPRMLIYIFSFDIKLLRLFALLIIYKFPAPTIQTSVFFK